MPGVRKPPARSRAAAKKEEPTLQLDDAHAIAILDKAVEYEVIDESGVPENKRQRINAAAEQVDLLIEAWTKGGINPDAKDKEKKEMGLAIQDILDLAGIEIDGDGEVTYGDLPDLDEEEAEAEDDNEGGDGEAAVDINDIIKDYEDLSAVARIKAIKALDLDMDDDDDYNSAVAIYEWEEAQEKPSSRVLTFLDDVLPAADGDGEAEEDGEDEPDEDAEEAGDGDGEEKWEEPWDKYLKQSAVEVKKYLDKLLAKDELSSDMLDYVADFENNGTGKPPRKRILDYIEKTLRPELGEEGSNGEEPEEDEAPARAGRPTAATRTRRGGRQAKQEEPEEEEAEAAETGGVFLVSADGIEPMTCYGVFMAGGAVADLLAEGYEAVQVDAG